MKPTWGGEGPGLPTLSIQIRPWKRRPFPSWQWKGQVEAQPNTVTLPRSSHKLFGAHSSCKDDEEHQGIHGDVLKVTFGPTSAARPRCFWGSHMGTRIYEGQDQPRHSCLGSSSVPPSPSDRPVPHSESGDKVHTQGPSCVALPRPLLVISQKVTDLLQGCSDRT